PWILPHLRGRPLALERCPDGINRPGFFQKDAPSYYLGKEERHREKPSCRVGRVFQTHQPPRRVSKTRPTLQVFSPPTIFLAEVISDPVHRGIERTRPVGLVRPRGRAAVGGHSSPSCSAPYCEQTPSPPVTGRLRSTGSRASRRAGSSASS